MITKDYQYILSVENTVESKIQDCINQICAGKTGNITRKLYIPCGAHILGRYVESIAINATEIATVEINGRAVDIMHAGYRGKS